MLKLLRLEDDLYVILTERHKPITGNKTKVILALEYFGVPFKEIEEGLVQLQLNDHHVAHYGINRTFIFTESKNDIR